jgi:hypothetical protein
VNEGNPDLTVTVVDPASGRSLAASIRTIGDDLVVVVGGGARPHVGCIVVATPVAGRGPTGFSPSISVLTIPPHKEEPIARAIAERVCSLRGGVTVVTGDELAEAVTERLAAD